MNAARANPGLLRLTRALSALIIVNTLPYLAGGLDHAFFVEKRDLARQPLWRAAFYLHVTGAMACLATGPLLFRADLRRRSPAAHRLIGRAYVLAVLVWAAPAGLALALTAKGGTWGRSCFVVLALGWFLTTAAGLAAIRGRRLDAHVVWMIRSYSLALSAVTFRVFQLALALAGVADEPNYIASLWLSLAASVVLAEAWVRAARRGRPVSRSPS